MKKYFVVSDVHGYYHEMLVALYEAGFDINNPDHVVISCGDVCDRGPDAVKCIKFFLELADEDRAILIRGNHEDLMEAALARRYFMVHDIHNRTADTACQITGITDPDQALITMADNGSIWDTYVDKCIDYYLLGDYIFVHGWIPTIIEYGHGSLISDKYIYNFHWQEANEAEWENARWLNGMKMWSMGIKVPDKTIVCGHWHTSWGHANLHDDGVERLSSVETYYIDPETGMEEPHVNYNIFYDKGIIALDAMTAVSHQVNCFTLEV